MICQAWTLRTPLWTSPLDPCKSFESTRRASGKPSSRAFSNSSSSSSSNNSNQLYQCRKRLTASPELPPLVLVPLAAAAEAAVAATMAAAGEATGAGHPGRITLIWGKLPDAAAAAAAAVTTTSVFRKAFCIVACCCCAFLAVCLLCTLGSLYIVSCSALLRVEHAASHLHYSGSSRYSLHMCCADRELWHWPSPTSDSKQPHPQTALHCRMVPVFSM